MCTFLEYIFVYCTFLDAGHGNLKVRVIGSENGHAVAFLHRVDRANVGLGVALVVGRKRLEVAVEALVDVPCDWMNGYNISCGSSGDGSQENGHKDREEGRGAQTEQGRGNATEQGHKIYQRRGKSEVRNRSKRGKSKAG